MVNNNDLFLKVDSVEPVYDISPFSYSGCSGGAPYLKGIKVWINGDGHFFECDRYTVCDPDAVREDGHRQAFGLMREIYYMAVNERKEAFGKTLPIDIVTNASYDDLAKKLDAWKKEKEKETIHIKDEVVQKLDSRLKFVVTEVHDGNGDTYISGVSKDGKVYPGHNIKNYKKTGLHVDDLDAYLEV